MTAQTAVRAVKVGRGRDASAGIGLRLKKDVDVMKLHYMQLTVMQPGNARELSQLRRYRACAHQIQHRHALLQRKPHVF